MHGARMACMCMCMCLCMAHAGRVHSVRMACACACAWHVHGIRIQSLHGRTHETNMHMQVLRDEGLAENARVMGELTHAP